MTFIPRPQGQTLRRAMGAIHDPHPAHERFDPDFPVAMKCDKCGKVGYGPRGQIQEALREHMESECSARRVRADEPTVTRILSPRV